MAIAKKIIVMLLMSFSGLAYGSEYDLLKACSDLELEHIPKLSLKQKEAKQFGELFKVLASEKVIPKNNKQILENFNRCWSSSIGSLNVQKLDIQLADTGLEINSHKIKYGESSMLVKDVKKLIRRLKVKDQHTKDLLWYAFTEALIASTNNRFNHYIYASYKNFYDVNSSGRRQQLGFIPSFKGDVIFVDHILDPELKDAGLNVGMSISKIESNTIKVNKDRNWWFQERAFDYKIIANDGESQVTVNASSIVQIQDSITALIHDDVAYIQIHYFNQRTDIDVWRFFRKLDDSISGIILDVRGNPGGSLNLELVSFFLKPHQLVAVIDENDGKTHSLNANMAYVNYPVVVLQDENSASMSELLSAMLQKQGRATVIGQTSFGKAAVQEIIPVSNEGRLALVKQHLYYPDAKSSWADIGVQPDIKIEVNEKQISQLMTAMISNDDFDQRLVTDVAIEKAITLLKKEKIQ